MWNSVNILIIPKLRRISRPFNKRTPKTLTWLVVSIPLKNMKVRLGLLFPIYRKKSCSPPTRRFFHILLIPAISRQASTRWTPRPAVPPCPKSFTILSIAIRLAVCEAPVRSDGIVTCCMMWTSKTPNRFKQQCTFQT